MLESFKLPSVCLSRVCWKVSRCPVYVGKFQVAQCIFVPVHVCWKVSSCPVYVGKFQDVQCMFESFKLPMQCMFVPVYIFHGKFEVAQYMFVQCMLELSFKMSSVC